MDRYTMSGYAMIVIGISIIMFSIAGVSLGATLAVARSDALLSFGGFIAAFGFITAGYLSSASDTLKASMIVSAGIVILATMSLL